MRPALNVVTMRLRSGTLPAPAEVAAMLHEAACDPREAAALAGQYAAALPSRTTGEAGVLTTLRGFAMPQ